LLQLKRRAPRAALHVKQFLKQPKPAAAVMLVEVPFLRREHGHDQCEDALFRTSSHGSSREQPKFRRFGLNGGTGPRFCRAER